MLPPVVNPTVYVITMRIADGTIVHCYTPLAPSNDVFTFVSLNPRFWIEIEGIRALPPTFETEMFLLSHQAHRLPNVLEFFNGGSNGIAFWTRRSFPDVHWDPEEPEAWLFEFSTGS